MPARRPAEANILRQQGKFDAFIEEFNYRPPTRGSGTEMPSRDLRRSPAYTGIPEPHYPFHNLTDMITSCGRICLYRKKINLSKSLASQLWE
jgi:hypothetical protein